ncbi:MAG: putative transposase [Halieaceae bacterium]|jgi:putative transposase
MGRPSADFLLTAKRDTEAALRFFSKAIGRNGKPDLINIDKIGDKKAGVKRITRSMLGFKIFHSAQSTLAGVELVAMLKKGQMKKNMIVALSPIEQFYALAA